MEATISITLKRGDGVTVARTVTVTSSLYDSAPVTQFKARARRRAIECLNSVLGAKAEVEITDAESGR
jgi:hypothetical protein